MGDLRRLLTTAANLEDEAEWLPPYFNEVDAKNMRDVAAELVALRARVAELETANALLRHDCAKAEVDIDERDIVVDRLESQIAAIKSVQRWGFPEYAAEPYRDPQGEFVLMEHIEDIIDKLPTSSGEG